MTMAQDYFVKETMYIDTSTGRLAIHSIRCKNHFKSDDPLLILCHGITYSSISVFDIPIDGKSLVEQMAAMGYHVFMPDYIGYGSSDKGNELSVTLDTAVQDVTHTVAWIRQQGFTGAIALLGWSWGAQVAGHLVTGPLKCEIKVLVLYGFKWHIDNTKMPQINELRRKNNAAHLKLDFTVPDNVMEEAVDTYVETALKIDPTSPNGPRQELLTNKNLAVSPFLINMPILIVHGHGDAGVDLKDNMDFFQKISYSEKQYAVLYGAHPLHMEKTSQRFIKIVDNFIRTYMG